MIAKLPMDVIAEFSRMSKAARTFANAVADKDDAGERLARLAQVFRLKDKKFDSICLARAARALAPGSRRVRLLTEWLLRKEAPLWHFRLVHDVRRNDVYARALNHFVRPGMVVFEIGTGTGLLAMLAVRAGASHVYTCEIRRDVADAARAIIAQNGMRDKITVIAKNAYDLRLGVDIPDRCDLFVAEIVDNSLLGEGVLPLTDFARKYLLKPDALLLPRFVSAMGCLVSAEAHREYYRVDSVLGFDLSAFNRFSPMEINAAVGTGAQTLSETSTLVSFDLSTDRRIASNIAKLYVNNDGLVEGLMRWLRLDFGSGIIFENGPTVKSCWDPHLHILDEPRPARVGDCFAFEISHDAYGLYVSEVPEDG